MACRIIAGRETVRRGSGIFTPTSCNRARLALSVNRQAAGADKRSG